MYPCGPKAKRAAKKSGWDWFGELDKNGDNQVTESEWLAWSERGRRRKKGKPYKEENHQKYFKKRDGNGDGIMTREELEASKK